ncbi:MAG: PAS domain S-box protein [Promethearchaeota archaeon]
MSNNKKKKDTKEHLQLIVNHIRDIIVESDLDGYFTYVSPQVKNILGYNPEEVIGTNGFKFIHPEDLPNLLSKMKNLIDGGGPISAEYRALHKDGHYVHLSANGTILRENENIKLTAVLRDISVQKEVEEKYQFITDNINDMISVFNDKFELLFINETQERISGFSKEEIIGKSPLEFLHPDDIKHAKLLLKEALKEGQGRGQYRMRTKDNSYKWMDVNGRVTFDSNGNKRILLVSRDITREKEIEIKLRESEEKYRLIFENANDLIKVLNNKFEYEDLNENVHRQILGYSKKELLKESPLTLVHPDDRKRSAILLGKILRKGKGSYQTRFEHEDGSYKWLEISAKNFVDGAGNKKIITIARDISDRKTSERKLKESEEKLKEQNKELEQLNNLKNEFLRRASHELKVPLVAIKGNADLILNLHYENLKPEVVKMIDSIQRGCERIEDIIHKLIESSKLETSKIELITSKGDIATLIKSCVDELQTFAKMKLLKIDVDIKDIGITKFNKEQIREVISNLLNNAINYSPPGGLIELRSEIKGNTIVTSIKDDGFGFTEDEKEKLFQKFGKFSRKNQGFDDILGGSGLGLYISKKIIELHGGEIWVESKGRNKGSTFYFTLPIVFSR